MAATVAVPTWNSRRGCAAAQTTARAATSGWYTGGTGRGRRGIPRRRARRVPARHRGHLLGSVWGTRAALRRMVPRDRGTIVQVGSALAYRGIPLQAPYCGAKHAIGGYHDSVRSELCDAGSSVRIAPVEVPGLHTAKFDRGRAKEARERR